MKKFLVLVLIMVSLMSFSACGRGSDSNAKFVRETNLELVNFQGLLSYDVNTKVIYYYFKDHAPYKGYGFMSPYISENGKYCRYENGKIVEIK